MENKLQVNSQLSLEQQNKIDIEIKKQVVYAFDFLNGALVEKDFEGIIKSIINEFVKTPADAQKVIIGIKRGYMGYYGRTYGQINFQEICVWVQCSLKNCKPKDLEHSKEAL